jgi:transposase-like protein
MSRRYSPDEKSAILAEFREQSASAAAFCRARGLSYQTFLNWRRAAGSRAPIQAVPPFVELDLSGVAPAGPGRREPLAELAIPGGAVLRVFAPESHNPARP